MIAIAQIASSWTHPRHFESSIAWSTVVISLQRTSDSLACTRTSAFLRVRKWKPNECPDSHFARYYGFSFYYTYSNVWIFKSKQATQYNIILLYAIVKICNDNCLKPRQHRTSIEHPDFISIWSKRPWT